MARGLWSGAISFGLINIPVSVLSAKESKSLSFHMLDKSDNAPIGYKQYNKVTGKAVERKNIVKGYEYEKSKWVIITEKDFVRANPKAARTIDIEDFVAIDEIDSVLFETPYFLTPGKNGEKSYALLKKTLESTSKAAVAQFVMHGKQHLVTIMPRGDWLILQTLRYAHEFREAEEGGAGEAPDLKNARVTDKELKMAKDLVEGMTVAFKPEKYKDTYKDDLMKRIKQKIKSGDVEESEEPIDDEAGGDENVVDLMPLLRKSLAASGSGKPRTTARKAPARKKGRGA